jgi:hypothetical protein
MGAITVDLEQCGNYFGTGRQELLVALAEGAQRIAFYVDESNDARIGGEHGNDDFGARRTEGGKPARIFLNVSNVDDRFGGDSGAAEAARYGEAGKLGRSRAGTSDHADFVGSAFTKSPRSIVPLARDPIRDALGALCSREPFPNYRQQRGTVVVIHSVLLLAFVLLGRLAKAPPIMRAEAVSSAWLKFWMPIRENARGRSCRS